MKNQKKHNSGLLTVKTGSTEEFFHKAKNMMRSLDKKENVDSSHTIIFEEPIELLHFLSESKIKLVNIIRNK